MKKTFKRTLSAGISAAVLISCCAAVPVGADTDEPYTGEITPLDVPDTVGYDTAPFEAAVYSYPTKEQISAKYNELNIAEAAASATEYSVNYSTTPPYAAGALSDTTLRHSLNVLNFVRYTAGVPSDVELSASLSEYAQYGSLVNAVNGSLSHYPEQPSDMSDEMFEKGYYGNSHSNIGYGYRSVPDSIIRGYMQDSDRSNIDRVGHRRWVLNPAMMYVGFGKVGVFTASYVFDRSRDKDKDFDYICWPAPNMPYELYGSGTYAFSVNLGSGYATPSIDDITVDVTSTMKGASWHLDKTSTDKTGLYLNVENSLYGLDKCIIFNTSHFDLNDTVTVSINGTKLRNGADAPIKYTVSFFSVNDYFKPVVNGLKAVGGNKQVALTWSAVSGATQYRIQRKSGSSWSTVSYPTTTAYTDTGLDDGTTYTYRVLAYANGKWGAPSEAVSAKTNGTAVDKTKVTGFTGNGIDNGIVLKWNAVKGAAKYRLQQYVNGAWATIAYPTANTYTHTGLINGTANSYRVLAQVNGAWGTPSAGLKVRVGITVTGFTGKGIDKGVVLKWDALKNAAKYRIQRINASNSWETVGFSNIPTYTDTNLKNGSAYAYRVLAYVDGAWRTPCSGIKVRAGAAAA